MAELQQADTILIQNMEKMKEKVQEITQENTEEMTISSPVDSHLKYLLKRVVNSNENNRLRNLVMDAFLYGYKTAIEQRYITESTERKTTP